MALRAKPNRVTARAVNRLPILGLCLLAAACGNDDRDEGSIKIPLATAASSAQPAVAASGATTALPTPAVWTHALSARAAWYGPPDAPALLAIACEGWEQRAGRIKIVRFAPADKGAEALFAIQGSKGILRLPVSSVRAGGGGYVWRGILDAADPRAEVLLGNGLKATVPGGGQLDLPPMGAAGAVVTDCVGAAARPAEAQTLPNLASNPETSPADR